MTADDPQRDSDSTTPSTTDASDPAADTDEDARDAAVEPAYRTARTPRTARATDPAAGPIADRILTESGTRRAPTPPDRSTDVAHSDVAHSGDDDQGDPELHEHPAQQASYTGAVLLAAAGFLVIAGALLFDEPVSLGTLLGVLMLVSALVRFTLVRQA